MNKIIPFFAVCAVAYSGVAYCLDEPVGSAYDSRIKTVVYNADDIVKVDSIIGVATTLVLDPSEKYLTHAFGDGDAWSFANKKNYYFIKPQAENGDTNLTIITDKREYNFDIRYYSTDYLKGAKGKTTFDRKMTFMIRFKYPEIESKKKIEAANEDKRKKEFGKLLSQGVNLKYSANGNKALYPVNVWDAKGFTYFKFSPYQDIPTITAVDSVGNEYNVQTHSEGLYKDIVVVHKVGQQFILRLGNAVAGVYNENDGSKPMSTNYTGTVSDNYKRVIINDE